MGRRKQYLVAYFAVPDGIEEKACALAELIGAELFEIRAGEPYTERDLDMSIRRSRVRLEEKYENERPMIKDRIYNMAYYDVIFLGYTVWEYGTPRIIQTFLEEYDFTGKRFVPFTTSEGDAFEESVAKLRELYTEPDWSEAKILHELPTREEAFRWGRSRRRYQTQDRIGSDRRE